MDGNLRETEILIQPELKPEQEAVIEAHTLLNVLNVLHGELTVIGLEVAHDDDYVHDAMVAVRELASSLRLPDHGNARLAQLSDFKKRVYEDLDKKLQPYPDAAKNPEVAESLANLESVFTVFGWRVAEILARVGSPDRWETMSCQDLRKSFLDVFAAIEKNSKGRYRIIYNLAQQEETDYYVHLDFASTQGDVLFMPPIFVDVMRDLMANSRKYTAPGGKMTCGLFEDERRLRLIVEDTGRGIPDADIPGVVEFGRRGSNVGSTRTMGGGFGLTKALYVTRRFGGRMWIASKVGVGTRIRIEIPRPTKQ